MRQLQGLAVPILHFPTALGAVVVTFNVNHIDRLRFDPDTLAGIFLGKITNWKDPAIRRNTTHASSRCADHRRPSRGRQRHDLHLHRLPLQGESRVAEPRSAGARASSGPWASPGVATRASPTSSNNTENSIGYVELIYSVQHDLPYGGVLNRAGKYVLPSLESVNAAATAAAANMPPDFRVSITDADGPDSYPISSFTWLLVPARFSDAAKGEAMKKFLEWMLADGQALAPSLLYAPLPSKVVELEREAIARVQVGSK